MNLLDEGMPLRRIIDQKVAISLILWGPPGTGKSSLAQIIAKKFDYPLVQFNASIDNKVKLERFIKTYPYQPFVLLSDEIHRMTKNLQDFLLPYLENGHILLVGATTENPIMSIVPAVRSRCQIFEFNALSDSDIESVLQRVATENFKLTSKQVEKNSLSLIAQPAEIKLAATTFRINNLKMNLLFNQIAPISDTVLPAEYHAYFTDEDGKLISNNVVIEANRTGSAADRTIAITITMQNMQYNLDKKYYLVIEREGSTEEPKRFEYSMDLIN